MPREGPGRAAPRRARPAIGPVALLALLLLAGGCRADGRPTRLVLVTLDTLRADAISGSSGLIAAADVVFEEGAMPALESWAAGGTRFRRCFSASSSTQPSHATLFTGLHPWEHGLARNGIRLAPGSVTLAERFRDAGFATAAVVASVPVSRRFGFDQGFDAFEDRFDRGQPADRWLPRGQLPEVVAADVGNRFYDLAGAVTDAALAELGRLEAADHFLWVHYFDTHDPYGDTQRGRRGLTLASVLRQLREDAADAAAGGLVERVRQRYALDARALDRELGRLLDRLDRDSGRFRTHVMIVSDHGEGLGERGSFGHGNRVTPGVVQVPCLVRSPRLEPGERHDVVGAVDLWRTLLALGGLSAGGPNGRDLTESRSSRGAVGMRQNGALGDPRLDGTVIWKETAEPRFFAAAPDGTLYRGGQGRLLTPIGPAADIAPDVAARLETLFAGFEETLAAARGEAVTDPELLEAMRALGYLGGGR